MERLCQEQQQPLGCPVEGAGGGRGTSWAGVREAACSSGVSGAAASTPSHPRGLTCTPHIVKWCSHCTVASQHWVLGHLLFRKYFFFAFRKPACNLK